MKVLYLLQDPKNPNIRRFIKSIENKKLVHYYYISNTKSFRPRDHLNTTHLTTVLWHLTNSKMTIFIKNKALL